ncbi:lipopolysaccharide biosynthesis protein [Nocardia puris]|uniref:lipopolysaccharide biosynthesis protein n=1 Tax=Nocardia puris TaxID=208602 RepID=UPI001893B356|nr:lipopolysaccharide biosynthesis protein [Nocardia puris]MBF6209868.1 lipopolysaccharide biosynthesis protein [Nocardia puris]MBF6366440.1 lipopolysaccharide biosynthesis protein [Nocardia puris]MBF6458221.1 lipopolysaccharide biosynthesis protein [Nocardia puris]
MSEHRHARLREIGAVLRDIVYVMFGKYGQYLITLATVPLTARVLGPEGMGLLAIGMAAYFIGSLLVDLGITSFLAALVPRGGPQLATLRGNYLLIRVAVLAALGLALGAQWALGAPAAVHMVFLGLFVGGMWAVSEDWILIGEGRFGTSTVYQGIARVCYLVLLVVLLPRFPSASVALLCLLGSALIVLALTWFDVVRRHGKPGTPHDVGATLRIGAPVLTARLLVSSYGQGAAVVYAAVLDAVSLGLFSAGDRLVRAVQSMLDPIGLAMLPRMARDQGADRFWRTTIRVLGACVTAAVAAVALIWVTAPLLIGLLFGSEFADAVTLLRVEALILPATTISSFLTTAVLPVRQDTAGVFIGACVGVAVAGVALAAGARNHSVWALVYGTVAAEFAVAGWYLLRARQLYRRDGGPAGAAVTPAPRIGEKL